MLRRLTRTITTPPPAPGFIGTGHTAVGVVDSEDLAASDPFVLLMDDRLDISPRRTIGGAHPHAGLETVTLVVEGTLHDRDEGALSAGDVLWMTAGRGIIHNEAVEVNGRARILQLWIALPARTRETEPRFALVRKADAPVVRAPGVSGRLYSGTSGDVQSSTKNHVPVTLVDLAFEAGATFVQALPPTYNGFLYVLEGNVRIADDTLEAGQVGWFAPSDGTELAITAGHPENGARVVLYAGEPLGEALVHHGPFVAGNPLEISAFYRRFRAGQFARMSELAERQVR